MSTAIPKDKWVWMPHAGHMIVGNKCQFHLTTKIGKYLISTIGEYWPEKEVRVIHAQIHDPKWLEENKHLLGDYFDAAYMKRFGFENLGYSRKYETMVFRAVAIKNSDKKCPSCLWVQKDGQDLDFEGYTNGGEAYAGHLKMCNKWAKK